MSKWTQVHGLIKVDTGGRSSHESEYLAKVTITNLPYISGSEGPAKVSVIPSEYYSSTCNFDEFDRMSNLQELFHSYERMNVVLEGYLRDRTFEETLKETSKWLTRLASRLWIVDCLVQVKDDYGKSFIFDSPEYLTDADLKRWELDESPPVIHGGFLRK